MVGLFGDGGYGAAFGGPFAAWIGACRDGRGAWFGHDDGLVGDGLGEAVQDTGLIGMAVTPGVVVLRLIRLCVGRRRGFQTRVAGI